MMIFMLMLLFLCVIGGAGFFLYWSNKSIVTTKYVLEDPRIPAAFDGYRILQVSDLQSEYFGKAQKNLLEKVAAAKPDIIVITGDLVDRNHTDYRAAEIAAVGLLEIAPVFYVSGNHEMALDEAEYQGFCQLLETLGVHVLFDSHHIIKKHQEELCLMGLSEHAVFRCKDFVRSNKVPADPVMLAKELSNLRSRQRKDRFTILLSHEPQYFDLYREADFHLIFSGHAHGGQIRLPFTDGLYAPGQGVLPKITSGMRRSTGATLVVSRGMGNSTFPFRIFNRPEVVFVELKPTGRN